MLCQKCHKNLATSRYAEVVEGKVSERHLCAECMAKSQEEAATGFQLTAAPTTSKGRRSRAPKSVEAVLPQRTCRACGAEFKEAMQTGRVGCSACYESFGDLIDHVLRGIHTGFRHRGKHPRLDDRRQQLRIDLQAKRALLRSALKAENYEDAARLRDEIRRYEEVINRELAQGAHSGSKQDHAEDLA
jgi:protein arginine kinase activator